MQGLKPLELDDGGATVLSMAHDVARGMAYLHAWTPPLIHRDLKSLNLLVPPPHPTPFFRASAVRLFGNHAGG